jgi:mycothiol synthase
MRASVLDPIHDGELGGWVWICNPPARQREDRAFLFGEVHPDHRARGVGRALRRWAVERATVRLRSRGHVLPKYIGVDAYDSIELAHRLYARLGFMPASSFDELIRPLNELPTLEVPEDVVLSRWPADRDNETLEVRNDAFTDHWGSAPIDTSTRQTFVRGHGARRDISVVAASVATGAIVGLCLNHAYPEEDGLTGRHGAWIQNLATLKAERGRGLATAMIGWSPAEFEAAGCTHAAMSVDADNPTGAARLYRNLGFQSLRRSITYQIEVE